MDYRRISLFLRMVGAFIIADNFIVSCCELLFEFVVTEKEHYKFRLRKIFHFGYWTDPEFIPPSVFQILSFFL